MSAPILPGATIGIIGGGQLGRMLALEARRMGYRLHVVDPAADAPAAPVCDLHLRADLDDADALLSLAEGCDVVTLEWENADVATLERIADLAPVRPGPHVLAVAQHRVREKEEARRLGVATADFRAVSSEADLRDALDALGTPAVLKTARWGYDGRGQRVIREPAEAADAYRALEGSGELILEAFVPFRLEISTVCARSVTGEVATFPVVENAHAGGILDWTLAPARVPEEVRREAVRIAEALAVGLDVVGLLAVEMFVEADGTVRMNEMAPRTHNSGHYTWEACGVSQFEQQVRAVCGLPLGTPSLRSPACMVNLLGQHLPAEGRTRFDRALEDPAVALHLYGKTECRTGRKMGHLTAIDADAERALARATAARERLASEA